jgi:hypothetical protein
LLNSDATVYGGSNQGNAGGVVSESIACLEDGVLKITVPKKEQEKVNFIPLK